MNEQELSAVLTRAGERLDPDVAALVAGGVRRGRRRRRRASATVALGAATVLALGGIAWQSAPGGGGRRAEDLAVATSPSSPDDQRRLPPDDVLVERLLDHLPEGEVTDVTTEASGGGPDSPIQRGLEISLLLDGVRVEVRLGDMSIDPTRWARFVAPGSMPEGCDASLVDADKATWHEAMRTASENAPTFSSPEEVELTPEQECVSWVSRKREQRCAAKPACLAKRTTYSAKETCGAPECRELADGSWLWPRTGDGGDGSDTSGFRGNWAGLFAPDGWMIDVAAFNSPDPDAGRPRVLRDDPPLSLDQVSALATAAFWFD
ncbi:hypothetical protein [Nocardioides nitrophenolicus]|uniref:hypothetical protein n=1 Tax=Nocardioides nitrophenolicus TaxID=60489 RepID=UPI00195BD6AB|nr:hypothetical protein [Nocardioides nitrophenolicus]MBM7515981.1 hypothetical protein [Nocardioides nitrophenolicus]